MKLAQKGKQYLEITEENLQSLHPPTEKIHLLKLNFECPTKDKLNYVLGIYKETYRYIVDNYIKFYNEYFKENHKKYYVENTTKDGIVTFFKRNNKTCFNFTVLNQNMKLFCYQNIFEILNNTEVVVVNKDIFEILEPNLRKWHGDVILK